MSISSGKFFQLNYEIISKESYRNVIERFNYMRAYIIKIIHFDSCVFIETDLILQRVLIVSDFVSRIYLFFAYTITNPFFTRVIHAWFSENTWDQLCARHTWEIRFKHVQDRYLETRATMNRFILSCIRFTLNVSW